MDKNGIKKWDFGFIGLVIAFVGLLIVGIVFLIRWIRAKKQNSTIQITPVEELKTDPMDFVSRDAPGIEEQKEIFKQIRENASKLGLPLNAARATAGVSCHETGRWGSELALKHNNLFGIKSGGAGKNIQTGTAGVYAKYDEDGDSLIDYVELIKAKNYPFNEDLTIEQHLQWMKSKQYFTAPLNVYKSSVISLINEMEG